MKYNLFRKQVIVGMLCMALIVPSFVNAASDQTISETISDDLLIVPISFRYNHWAQVYVDELLRNYSAQTVFNHKDLNAVITEKDFQSLVKLVLDQDYENVPDAMTREAVVYELTKIWADKTGNNLDEIPVIRMLVYPDLHEVDTKYYYSIIVAYMRNIAKGKDTRKFDPKAEVTYGELATLVSNTHRAIEDELKSDIQPILKGRFETKGNCEIKDDKVVFNFELMSHHTTAKTLQFGSGQQFEVVVTNQAGEEVYRYSDGKFFTMALVFKTINPGECIKWQDEWDMTNRAGEKLVSGNYKAEINILVILEDDKQAIEQSELTTAILFNLYEHENVDE